MYTTCQKEKERIRIFVGRMGRRKEKYFNNLLFRSFNVVVRQKVVVSFYYKVNVTIVWQRS